MPMILPAGLSIKDKDLVHVKRGLREVVEFDRAGERKVRVIHPHLRGIERRGREVKVDILSIEKKI